MSIRSENHILWMPPDPIERLTIFVEGEADSSTVAGMHTINGAADKWLEGEMDDYTYFELLDHFGIDPLSFVGEVEDQLHSLMR